MTANDKRRPLRAAEMAASLALGLCFDPALAADADQSPLITVTGQREAAPLDRIATPRIDTPQAITSITAEALEARGIANLNDALRNVAGLSIGAGETSFQGNNAILRGFTTRNDLFVDNARDYGYYFRDTFDDESVEVLKGPSSILFGRGSTGGVIHRIGKAPRLETAISAEARIGTDDTRRISLDANIGEPLGSGSAFRINGVFHHSAVAARDTASSQRWALAPRLALGLGTDTRLFLSYVYQQEDNRPDYGIPWFAGTPANPGFPAPVDRRNYYGFTNDRLDTNVNIATARLVHDASPGTQLRAQIRYSNNRRDFRYSEAIIPAGTPRTADLDSVTVTRNLFEASGHDRYLQGQAEIDTQFSLGSTRHRVIAGIEAGTESTDPRFFTNINVPTTSLGNPVGGFYDSPANRFLRLSGAARSRFLAAFAIDTIEFGPQWRAIVGLRWDSFQTRYDSQRFTQSGTVDRTTAIDRTDRNLAWRAALVWKPAPTGSIYLSYANSFNPSGEGVESLVSVGRTVAEGNINLDPETSYSFEFGTKWNLFGGPNLLSASVFRIEKDNVRVPDPLTPGFNTLGGRQRVDGAEIEFSGKPLPGWSISAGYAFLDSQTVESTPNGPIVGAALTITPRHSGSFSTAYDITPKFNAGFNLVVSSSRLGQNTPGLFLVAGGYAVADISLRYHINDRLTVRLLVNNITDRLFYDGLHPFHVIPGAGRSALLTLKASL